MHLVTWSSSPQNQPCKVGLAGWCQLAQDDQVNVVTKQRCDLSPFSEYGTLIVIPRWIT